MNTNFSSRSLFTHTGRNRDAFWCDTLRSGRLVLAGLTLIAIPAAPILGAAPASPSDRLQPELTWSDNQRSDGNSLLQVRHMLMLLQLNLNLSPGQIAAWDVWSAGMIAECQRQFERANDADNVSLKAGRPPHQTTTPERMAHEINHLRTQVASLEVQLDELESSRMRTDIFYNTLNANQKNTFDAFWSDSLSIYSGRDPCENPRRHRYQSPIT